MIMHHQEEWPMRRTERLRKHTIIGYMSTNAYYVFYFIQNAMSLSSSQIIKQCIQSFQACKRVMLTFIPLVNAEAEPIAKYAITISVKVETMVMSVPLGLFPSLRSSGLVPQVWLPWSS
jgi:hypothetical protein